MFYFNISENTYCYALLMEGQPKIDLKRVSGQNDVHCAQHCNVEESCVMWRFMEKKKRCSLVQLTAETGKTWEEHYFCIGLRT